MNETERKEYQRKYRQEHRDERRIYSKKYRQEHKKYFQEWRLNLKREVLTHYGGGKCACVKCGEARLACLSIDHINGGGFKHITYIKNNGDTLYLWLRRNSYPDGYQTLCMNDQWVKRMENNENRGEI